MGTLTLDTGARTVSIRHKPIVDPLVPILPWTVSGSVTDIVTAQNITYLIPHHRPPQWRYAYNRYTGQLSGKPVRTGSYTVKIAASNLAGTSPTISTTIPVSALPDAGMGTFHGLVDRHLNMSQDFLGGMFRLSTSATGAASGTLTFGARTWRFRGRLDAVEGIDPATILVSRGRTLPPSPFRSRSIKHLVQSQGQLLTASIQCQPLACETLGTLAIIPLLILLANIQRSSRHLPSLILTQSIRKGMATESSQLPPPGPFAGLAGWPMAVALYTPPSWMRQDCSHSNGY